MYITKLNKSNRIKNCDFGNFWMFKLRVQRNEKEGKRTGERKNAKEKESKD